MFGIILGALEFLLLPMAFFEWLRNRKRRAQLMERLFREHPETHRLERYYPVVYCSQSRFNATMKFETYDSKGILALLPDRILYWEAGAYWEEPSVALRPPYCRAERVGQQRADWFGTPWVAFHENGQSHYFGAGAWFTFSPSKRVDRILDDLRETYGEDLVPAPH